MNFSPRETVLVWSTLAVLLGCATYFLASSKREEWRNIRTSLENIEKEIILNERLIDQHGTWTKRLDASLEYIQSYPPGEKVTPKLLESIEQLARQNNLRLESLSPDDENSLGDVYEVAIKCTWQGDLEACVRFLYALQSEGGKYKVRSLTVSPTGKSGMLKGIFVVDCAYTRSVISPSAPLTVVPVTAR